jgi:hypothetical protein
LTPAFTLAASGDVASGCRTRSPAALSRLNPCANIACAAFGVGAVAFRPSRCDATTIRTTRSLRQTALATTRLSLPSETGHFSVPASAGPPCFGPHQEFRSPSARTARMRNPTLRPRLRQTWSWRDVSTRRPFDAHSCRRLSPEPHRHEVARSQSRGRPPLPRWGRHCPQLPAHRLFLQRSPRRRGCPFWVIVPRLKR